SAAKLYAPDSLVTTVFMIPVPVFVAVTVTPGIKAPLASATVPPTVALIVCEKPFWAIRIHSKNTMYVNFLRISPHSFKVGTASSKKARPKAISPEHVLEQRNVKFY